MKRSILALVLALAMALALAACGRGDETAASAQPTADTAKKAENITLCPTYDNGKGGYFSVTLPASWGDNYLTECGAERRRLLRRLLRKDRPRQRSGRLPVHA